MNGCAYYVFDGHSDARLHASAVPQVDNIVPQPPALLAREIGLALSTAQPYPQPWWFCEFALILIFNRALLTWALNLTGSRHRGHQPALTGGTGRPGGQPAPPRPKTLGSEPRQPLAPRSVLFSSGRGCHEQLPRAPAASCDAASSAAPRCDGPIKPAGLPPLHPCSSPPTPLPGHLPTSPATMKALSVLALLLLAGAAR